MSGRYSPVMFWSKEKCNTNQLWCCLECKAYIVAHKISKTHFSNKPKLAIWPFPAVAPSDSLQNVRFELDLSHAFILATFMMPSSGLLTAIFVARPHKNRMHSGLWCVKQSIRKKSLRCSLLQSVHPFNTKSRFYFILLKRNKQQKKRYLTGFEIQKASQFL